MHGRILLVKHKEKQMLNSYKEHIYSWMSERVNDIRLRSFFESEKPEFAGMTADKIYKKLLATEIYEPLGKLIVYPERLKDWLEFASGNGFSIVSDFLVMIDAISKNTSIEEIKTLVDDHRGFISSAVLLFSKKGPEFYKKYNPDYISNPDLAKLIENIEAENLMFQNHTSTLQQNTPQ